MLESLLQSNIKETDLASLYLFKLSHFHHDPIWWGGTQSDQKQIDQKKNQVISLSLLSAREKHLFPYLIPKSLSPQTSLFTLLNEIKVKKVPIKAQLALRDWYLYPERLQLFFRIPSPYEILVLQSQGRRCLTIFPKEEDLKRTFEHNRNSWDFFLHDLEHADRFFSQDRIYHPQIGLCRCLLLSYEKLLQLIPHQDYQKRLDYLISDMNTHVVHMLKYLKATVLHGFLFLENKTPHEKLSPQGRAQYEAFLRSLFNDWTNNEKILLALTKVNSPAEPLHAQELEDYFYQRGLYNPTAPDDL